jgi:ADP-ribose pyrophosphatase YjhB (NUDIX family)
MDIISKLDFLGNFHYISIAWSKINIDVLCFKNLLIMSDWIQWAIFIAKAEKYKNNCSMNFVDLKELPDRNKVTSVLVIPFVNQKKIVLTYNQRWLDLPWWHIEDCDWSCEETAHREVLEETWVEIGNLKFIWALESDYFWKKPEQLTYILIYWAQVKSIKDYNGNMECSGREIQDYETFLSQYTWQVIDDSLMKKIVDLSKTAIYWSLEFYK